MEAVFHLLRRFAFAALLLLVGCESSQLQTADLCQDPRIIAEYKARGYDHAYCGPVISGIFRDGWGEQEIQIVQVPKRQFVDYDAIGMIFDAFARFSNGELVNWGSVAPFSRDWVDLDLDRQLGIHSGPMCCKAPSVLYQMYLKRDGARLCTFYEMRHPFHGVLRDCGEGFRKITGTAGYVPGTVTIRQAWEMASERALVEIGPHLSPAGSIDMRLTFKRDADGTPYYLAEIRERLDEMKSNPRTGREEHRFQFHSYRVETMGGKTSYLGVREGDDFLSDRWVK